MRIAGVEEEKEERKRRGKAGGEAEKIEAKRIFHKFPSPAPRAGRAKPKVVHSLAPSASLARLTTKAEPAGILQMVPTTN